MASVVPRKTVLVLGGSGFVGSHLVRVLLHRGYDVVSASQTGRSPMSLLSLPLNNLKDVSPGSLQTVKVDARDALALSSLVQSREFNAYAHCVGVLFDSSTLLSRFNVKVSHSKSLIDPKATYDDITRRTAENLLNAIVTKNKKKPPIADHPPPPFVFVSASEAGWSQEMGLGGRFANTVSSFVAPWLYSYLEAKRAVERLLLGSDSVRGVVMRPALVFTTPNIFTHIFGFVANTMRLLPKGMLTPFVDKPIHVEDLADGMARAIEDAGVRGIFREELIVRLLTVVPSKVIPPSLASK